MLYLCGGGGVRGVYMGGGGDREWNAWIDGRSMVCMWGRGRDVDGRVGTVMCVYFNRWCC